MEKNEIIEARTDDLAIVKEYQDANKIAPDFFELMPYDLVQSGYPYPTKGIMVARPFGGTNKEGQLIDGTNTNTDEMWCKVSDVKKWLNDDEGYKKMREYAISLEKRLGIFDEVHGGK